MKFFISFLTAAVFSSGLLPAAERLPQSAETLPATARDGMVRALLIGGGSSHDFESFFHHADRATLQVAGKITAAYAENPAEALELIPNADVIVLSANHPGFGTPEFQQALNAFANAGHGVVILHAATWYNWNDAPAYNRRFVGGGAQNHGRGEFSVFNRQPAHPVMQGIPAEFKITDEQYHVVLDPGAPVEVLAETGVEAASGKAYPSVWVVKDPKARIVDIALGHAAEAHSHPAYQQLLVNAVRWVSAPATAKTEPLPVVSTPSSANPNQPGPAVGGPAAKKPQKFFTEPGAIDFNDHDGYVPLFDGVSLKGWDGNPKFWRVADGAIVGESTPQNPCGNTYLVYRDLKARDFTLKFEMKIVGSGGSGFQYRSQTGIPWLASEPPQVKANVGPYNLDWMLTGPQADFWPVYVYTGQFYSENTPMRIIAWRGQVVECYGVAKKRLLGNIGDRKDLGSFVKRDDWNEYTVIARGGTFIHIVNGQLMAVLVDDDPASSNNQPGLFGIELEAITQLYVRNIWVKKLN